MVVPHTAHTAVSPERENLPDDGHPSQGTVGQLHNLSVTDLLHSHTDRIQRLILSIYESIVT